MKDLSELLPLRRVWSGRYPAFWDVTPWMTLADGYLVTCSRDERTRERLVECVEFETGNRTKIATVCNIILGSIGSTVYLARIADARSHLAITRITRYVILGSAMSVLNNDTFLTEKFKVPPLTNAIAREFRLGNQALDLFTGNVVSEKRRPNWDVGSGCELIQRQDMLCCFDDSQRLLWSKEGWMGNWFHGARGDILYFLLPSLETTLVLLDRTSGRVLVEHNFENLKRITKRIGGCFDVWNTASFDSTTVFDVIVNEYEVAWITVDNRLHVRDLSTGYAVQSETGEYDLLLASWEHRKLLLYEVQDAERGQLVIVRLEDR